MPLCDSQSLNVGTMPDGRQELKLVGEINVFLAADLQRAAVQLAGQGGDAVVNCQQAQSLDFAALQILVALADALRAQGRTCQVAELSADLTQAISRAGLRPHLIGPDAPSPESAQTGRTV